MIKVPELYQSRNLAGGTYELRESLEKVISLAKSSSAILSVYDIKART